MDDVKLALLGDRAAQERITERGEMLPCAHCGARVKLKECTQFGMYKTKCVWCGAETAEQGNMYLAIFQNNTRAPILSAEELERLKGEGRT